MSEGVGGLVVNPAGAAGAAVADRSEPALVASVAIQFALLLVDVVGKQRLFAGGADGAFLVIDVILDGHPLRTEHCSATLGTVSFGFFGLDCGRVNQLVVNVR